MLSALDDSEFKFMIPGEPRPSLPVALAGGGQTRDLPVYRHGGGCQCSPGPPAGGPGRAGAPALVLTASYWPSEFGRHVQAGRRYGGPVDGCGRPPGRLTAPLAAWGRLTSHSPGRLVTRTDGGRDGLPMLGINRISTMVS
jgi:hypothetical protein